ncbi:ribonuclease H-like protein [Trametes sanguinea]|nr:ribonuclease H-like protein [Trametes sanguinea]
MTDTAEAVKRPPRPFAVQNEDVTVYTDGSSKFVSKEGRKAGSGVWFAPHDGRNLGVRLPEGPQTNQAAEVYAVSLAAAAVPPYHTLTVKSDSRLVVEGLSVHAKRWESCGWIGVANADLLKDAIARLRARSAPTYLQWVKGHAGERGNEGADELASIGADLPLPDGTSLPACPSAYLRQGANLQSLTQRLAVRGIHALQGNVSRQKTERLVGRVLATVADDWPTEVSASALWKGIRHKDFRRTMRDFWWLALHDALRVGTYWDNIPGYEHRSNCAHCGCVESLEHILLECTAPGQGMLWALAKWLLSQKGVRVPALTFGLIMAAPALSVSRDRGRTRFTRMVLSETCHLVWKIRCERVIGRDGSPDLYHSNAELRQRLLAAVDRRLQIDRQLARSSVRAVRLERALVLDTWRGVLEDERSLPDDWICAEGVLVGRPPNLRPRDPG